MHQLHKRVFALQCCDVVISRRRTWGEGKASRTEKNTRKRGGRKKKEIEERAIDTAHVIGCFVLRLNNLDFGNIFRTSH
jgi:hypothetical protein